MGRRIDLEVLDGARARYGAELLKRLGQQLSLEFGRGFESRNLRRMLKFAQAFPDEDFLPTLSTKLSWSHLVAIVALQSDARERLAGQRILLKADAEE